LGAKDSGLIFKMAKEMEEKEHVEKELSKLLETTLRLENELYLVQESQ